ncbi:hypothetical protein [Caldivirga maquilingensis]|uniref:Uncharacterized protein n=1 Tax=Caldivirga maquilingensis (strain ATCC 700844 / DSM 13496 / JCM 10307 / IC-167) TaxID=397948 RepID=A8MBP0_CALMQ|nr:hypothetical protein [Caldivirga maquilingensis]ABW02773.1 hypothetical protein Cmaq_1957 [Caldivirga maquilingensis IC-167]
MNVRVIIIVGIIDDISNVIRLLETYRSKCSGSCVEVNKAVDELRSIANEVGIMLDFISRTFTESQRLLARYLTTSVNVESGLLKIIMDDGNDEYLDDLVKKLNASPDQVIKILEILKASGLVDYTLKYDNNIRVLIRRRSTIS